MTKHQLIVLCNCVKDLLKVPMQEPSHICALHVVTRHSFQAATVLSAEFIIIIIIGVLYSGPSRLSTQERSSPTPFEKNSLKDCQST